MIDYNLHDYRSVLKKEFNSRVSRNAQYSLRAFAKFLNIPASTLSEILNGISGISNKRAINIASKLQFEKAETEFFLSLVEIANAKSEKSKQIAKAKLKKFESEEYKLLKMDSFKMISEWWHFAILELTYIKNFEFNAKEISKVLQITEEEANDAIDRLLRLNLLKKIGKSYHDANNFLASPDGIPSGAIRNQHKVLLNKAIDALEEQSIDERDFSIMMMSFDSKRINEAKEFLKKTRRAFNKKFTYESKPDSVYALTINLFNLTQNMNKSSEE